MKTTLFKITFALVFITFIGSCSTDDLEPSTEQQKPVEGGIESVSNAFTILKGAYNYLTLSGYYGRDYIINNEVRTDNTFSNGNSGRFVTQASYKYNANTGTFWDEAYAAIGNANIIIALDIPNLTGDEGLGLHLQGQAYAIRALVHFDLLKQYGQMHVGGTLGIPYVTEFLGEDRLPSRKTIVENKTMILEDIQKAYDLMDEDYAGSKEFISKFTAKALESRIALYFEDWTDVINAAETVITSGKYSIIAEDTFLKSWEQKEAANSLFEIAFSSTDNIGINGLAYIYRNGGPPKGTYGDIQVIAAVFDIYDATDVRRNILGYEKEDPDSLRLRNMKKYPDMQGYDNIPIIRYEEVILNYAEALFEDGQTGEALLELNRITSNRGAEAYTTITKENILNERRKELMFEGFRYDDILRTGSDIIKFSAQQNIETTIPYGDYRLALPIPKAEVDANSNMKQNPGY